MQQNVVAAWIPEVEYSKAPSSLVFGIFGDALMHIHAMYLVVLYTYKIRLFRVFVSVAINYWLILFAPTPQYTLQEIWNNAWLILFKFVHAFKIIRQPRYTTISNPNSKRIFIAFHQTLLQSHRSVFRGCWYQHLTITQSTNIILARRTVIQ